jgi:hypothetical protein
MKKSMNPKTESTPRQRHMKKKITEKKFSAGRVLIRAGKTTNRRSGPDFASSKVSIPLVDDT